jgi:hypothetical protein
LSVISSPAQCPFGSCLSRSLASFITR